MHTTECTQYRFFHNGDYSGDVTVMNKETKDEIDIPFSEIKSFVAEWARSEKIRRLEDAGDDELLLQNSQAERS